MDSAHLDDHNLAHSATGRNVTNKVDNSSEVAKLKDDHGKQIQNMIFESRIKILELEKEMSNQDKEQKMKILQLEKDNQSLTHELELMKLKITNDLESHKGVINQEMLKQQNELQNKLAEKDKEIAAKENECKAKINETEKAFLVKEHDYQTKMAAKENEYRTKMVAKENEFALKMKDLEKNNEIKLGQMEREKELAIQALRQKIESMEANNENELKKDPLPESLPIVQPPSSATTKEDKLLWGANKYLLGIETGSNLFTSYKDWYEAISALLENGIPKSVKHGGRNFFFIRKEKVRRTYPLYLVTRRRNVGGYFPNGFALEYPNREELRNAKSILLHPKQRGQCIMNNGKFKVYEHLPDSEEWSYPGVTKNHYFGEKNSIIVFLYL
uniref:Uncharacterized protein n=1 Tax=Clytia hemisphaerica TaxID=252671 RepID=A0A7M5XK14_9CNID